MGNSAVADKSNKICRWLIGQAGSHSKRGEDDFLYLMGSEGEGKETGEKTSIMRRER